VITTHSQSGVRQPTDIHCFTHSAQHTLTINATASGRCERGTSRGISVARAIIGMSLYEYLVKKQ
jgi:hypothetical protein